MNPETSLPARRRKLGWLLMAMGLLIGAGFWWVVIVVRSSAPDYDPHRSPAGYWRDVQTALHISWWRYEHSMSVGPFGDEIWAKKIMETVASGKEFKSYQGRYRDSALNDITNHDFSSNTDAKTTWLGWWQENKSKTQEEWIQEGFKAHGFNIALRPTKEDWPKLLHILGATVGPGDSPYIKRLQMFYPAHLRYNAYRWLRDSGFDPVYHAVVEAPTGMTPEQSGGLIDYGHFEYWMGSPPLPGRMVFHPPPDWGHLGPLGKDRPPVSLRYETQIIFTLISLAFLWAGWKFARPGQNKVIPLPITKRRIVGGSMMITAGLMGVGFWTIIVPSYRGRAPEFSPQLSAAGFWETKQNHLNLGLWWHEDGNVVGVFGGKEWTAKIMQWMAAGKDIESCAAGHRDGALPLLTNHDFSDAADAKSVWLDWWSSNGMKTQEEWIQDGFKRYGFDIALPPTKKDWRPLLQILGSGPGPAAAYPDGEPRPQGYLYPYALCYNAYRWLRDSGFEPVFFALTNDGTLSGEETSGLLRYRQQVEDLSVFEAPLPGRLSFAPEPKTGYFGMSVFYDPPLVLQPSFQVQVSVLLMVLWGLGFRLAQPRKTS